MAFGLSDMNKIGLALLIWKSKGPPVNLTGRLPKFGLWTEK